MFLKTIAVMLVWNSVEIIQQKKIQQHKMEGRDHDNKGDYWFLAIHLLHGTHYEDCWSKQFTPRRQPYPHVGL